MTDKRTFKRRLLKLADFLETVPAKKFHIKHWTRGCAPGVDVSCGTSACAAGWATAIPSFRRAGFRLNEFGGPMFQAAHGFAAVEGFFGTINVFREERYASSPSREDVATALRGAAESL